MWCRRRDTVPSSGRWWRVCASLATAMIVASSMVGVVGASVAAASTLTLVADIDPTGSSDPMSLTPFQGGVAFTARDEAHGRELWFADRSGARLLRDIRPGASSSGPSQLVVSGGTLYFTAVDGTHGRELWATDGTTAGTRLVRDIRVGSAGSAPAALTAYRGRLLFSAADGTHGRELWTTDGTRARTRLVVDLHAGDSVGTGPWVVMGGRVHLDARGGLWRTDGTASGTRRVRAHTAPTDLVATGSRVFFIGHRGSGGGASDTELWVSDGTTVGTRSLGHVASSTRLVTMDGAVYFAQGDGARRRLHRATRAGQVTVTPKVAVDDGIPLATSAHRLFLVDDGRLVISDGTGGGSRTLPAWIGEWGTLQVLRLGDRWYTTGERAGDTVLWRTTGTTSGTKVAAVIATDSEQAVPMARSGGALWLSADDGVHGRELLRFDP